MNLRIFNFYPTVNQFLFIFCSISICARIALMLYGFPNENYLTHADQGDYLRLAYILDENLNFGKHFGSGRLPIYPLFISLVLKISKNLYFLVFVQHLIGLLTILTIFKIGKIFSLETGLIAAFFAAINFNLAIHGNFILTESIFVLIFTIFLYLSLKFLKNRNVKFLVLMGIFLGLSSLIRPTVIYLPFLIIFFILFLNSRFLKKIKFIIIFLVFYMIVVLPWLTRNHLIYESFSFTSQEAPTLIGWYLPHIDQYEKKINIAEARKLRNDDWQLFLNDIPDQQKSNPFKLEKFVKRYTVQEIAKFEKISIIKAWFWGAMKNIFSPPFVDFAYFYKIPHSSFYETQGASFLKQFKPFYKFLAANWGSLKLVRPRVSGVFRKIHISV